MKLKKILGGNKLNKKNIRDTPKIVIPKGWKVEEFLDTDDSTFAGEEPILTEEVKLVYERDIRKY